MRNGRAQAAVVSPAREGQVKPPSLSLGSQPLCRSWSGQMQECSDGSYASPRITGTFGFSASHGICNDKIFLGITKIISFYTPQWAFRAHTCCRSCDSPHPSGTDQTCTHSLQKSGHSIGTIGRKTVKRKVEKCCLLRESDDNN